MAWFIWEIWKLVLEKGGQNQEVTSYSERNRMPFDALNLLDVMKVVLLHTLSYHNRPLIRIIIGLDVLLYV